MRKTIRIITLVIFLLYLPAYFCGNMMAQDAGSEKVCEDGTGIPYVIYSGTCDDNACLCPICKSSISACDGVCLNSLCERLPEVEVCKCFYCMNQFDCTIGYCTNPDCFSNLCTCSLCNVDYVCGTIHHCPTPDEEEDPIDVGGGGGGKIVIDPCSGIKDGKPVANPLKSMRICPTPNTGVAGGDFGNARGRMHNGIDLAGTKGTPIYATQDGTIQKSVNNDPVSNSGLAWDDYVKTYKPSKEQKSELAAGKRVNINCENGVVQKNFHLNGVAINPRTGKVFKEGDIVYKGDIIGYLGNSGSASSESSGGTHLHFEVRENGSPVDPKQFLYSTFDLTTGIGTGC